MKSPISLFMRAFAFRPHFFRFGALALVVVLPAIACRDVTRLHGTSVVVTVDAKSFDVDQLEYRGLEADTELFPASLRPEVAAGPLPSISVVRVLLPDSLDGKTIDVLVRGLNQGTVLAEGRGRVVVVKGVEKPVSVELAGMSVGGCDGCTGCCSNGNTCVTPGPASCGVNGAACTTCDARTTNECGADGRCACGASPPCTLAIGADNCNAGTCHCGTGPACEPGVECLQRVCQCTAASCAGCCMGGRCLMGDAPVA